MVSRYSDCHFAEVMDSLRCSFCGEGCNVLDSPSGVGLDLELTLRRWKDGDCPLDDMFKRLETELDRTYMMTFRPAQAYLQKDQLPKYEYHIDKMIWLPRPNNNQALEREAAN